jgi:AraC-like DNA-binding protein
MKLPPCPYRRQLRVEHAKELLLNSDEKVQTIALASGYKSLSYFTRDFRKTVGMPPSKFREIAKKPLPPRGGP